MSPSFKPVPAGVRMTLDPAEVELLRSLHDGLETTLDDVDEDDPVIERLFPAAVDGDDEADRELRRLLRDDLLEQRRAGLTALMEVLDRAEQHRGKLRVELVDDDAHLVLGVLNDLRLAIGARIGIEHLDRTAVVDEGLAYRLAVMDHLGWMQEQLLAVVDPASVQHRQPEEDA